MPGKGRGVGQGIRVLGLEPTGFAVDKSLPQPVQKSRKTKLKAVKMASFLVMTVPMVGWERMPSNPNGLTAGSL
jgi:hypothetical protein